MRRSLAFPIILISILLFAEISSFIAVKTFFLESRSASRWFNWIWWISTIALYAMVFTSRAIEGHFYRNVTVNIFMFFLFVKLFIGLVFCFALLVQFVILLFRNNVGTDFAGRRNFTAKLALGLSAIPFSSMIYGLAVTAYDFKTHRVNVKSKKLSSAFNGYRIVQLSDIHTGSLQGKKQLEKAVEQVNQLNPDLIVFTGDLVNNESAEALEYMDVLGKLKAKDGIYSVLGNHDYGDYNQWESSEAKSANMKLMYQIHRDLGWRLLMNENVIVSKDDASFNMIGIENWGANLNFKKYGDLSKALEGIEHGKFNLLLSHDPSHWSYEVNKYYKSIDLTLSGHTHGFQFGIEIPGFKWSPSKYIYPQWAGLYGDGEQLLYVNRGLGCLGYMGRIGIKPEITLIELESDA